ncbi:hypothetical protein AB0M86_32630 [Streptomyces sp. NPDC051639]|uniref:hypothetical protein n=1 Tax=unclassified Streptomyces TaxID=2593676 RepID=UPI00143E9787|nr:hypothetical protein [Streptomyces sp. RPA4-2]QIY66279.1 hypothetical protein HEP85_37900 [Streptomyces sp. RPA4-2]
MEAGVGDLGGEQLTAALQGRHPDHAVQERDVVARANFLHVGQLARDNVRR